MKSPTAPPTLHWVASEPHEGGSSSSLHLRTFVVDNVMDVELEVNVLVVLDGIIGQLSHKAGHVAFTIGNNRQNVASTAHSFGSFSPLQRRKVSDVEDTEVIVSEVFVVDRVMEEVTVLEVFVLDRVVEEVTVFDVTVLDVTVTVVMVTVVVVFTHELQRTGQRVFSSKSATSHFAFSPPKLQKSGSGLPLHKRSSGAGHVPQSPRQVSATPKCETLHKSWTPLCWHSKGST